MYITLKTKHYQVIFAGNNISNDYESLIYSEMFFECRKRMFFTLVNEIIGKNYKKLPFTRDNFRNTVDTFRN